MWAAQGWSDPERIMSQSCDVVFYEQPFKEPRRIVTDSEDVPQISGHPDKWIRSQNQRVWTQDLSESTEVVVLFFFFSFLFSSRLWVKSILSGLLEWNFSFSSAPLFFDHGGGLRSVLYKKVLSAVTPHPPPSLPPWSFVSFSPKFLFLFFSSPSRSGSQSTEPQALTHVHSVSWFIDDGVMTSSSVSGFLQYVFSSHTNLRVRRRLLFFMKLLLQFWPLIIYQSSFSVSTVSYFWVKYF